MYLGVYGLGVSGFVSTFADTNQKQRERERELWHSTRKAVNPTTPSVCLTTKSRVAVPPCKFDKLRMGFLRGVWVGGLRFGVVRVQGVAWEYSCSHGEEFCSLI